MISAIERCHIEEQLFEHVVLRRAEYYIKFSFPQASCFSTGDNTSKGGTAEGTKHFEQGDIIYIVVGGTGGNHEGGYNGGGAGFVGGGGATHMAQRSGVLSSLEANKSSVLLVAGGRWRSFERIL